MNHEGFLRAIFAAPNDDNLRLVYADWLEDHDEAEYAEFIRVQCELAGHQEEDDRWLSLKIREEELFARLKDLWTEHRRWLNDKFFRRGLISSLALTPDPAAFVQQAHNFHFLLDIAHLTIGGVMCDEFFACPQLWRVRAMNCERCNVRDSSLLPFAAANYFENLTSIDFFRNYIGPEGISALARCPSLANLTYLCLSENRLGDEGVRALVCSAVCTKLESLNLCENQIGDEGACALASSPHLANLRQLVLHNNRITRHGVVVLRRSPYLTNLRDLHLDELEEEDFEEINLP